jgi:hypothetical protein
VDLGMDYNERNVFAYQKRQLNAHLRLKHYTSLAVRPRWQCGGSPRTDGTR